MAWLRMKLPRIFMSDLFGRVLKKTWIVPTFDGRNLANQLRLVVYPILYTVLCIPGGAGFLPSTVFPFQPELTPCSGLLPASL